MNTERQATDCQFVDAEALISFLDTLMDDGGQGGEKWGPAQAAIAGIRSFGEGERLKRGALATLNQVVTLLLDHRFPLEAGKLREATNSLAVLYAAASIIDMHREASSKAEWTRLAEVLQRVRGEA